MMKLRKFELIFVVITLAFLIFMGGFFTGRNFNQVSIDSFDSLQVATSVGSDSLEISAQLQSRDTGSRSPDVGISAGESGADIDADNTEIANSPNQAADTSQSNDALFDVPPGAPRGGDGRININTASKNELMDLPGIGPSLADSIIEYRNSNGSFAAIEDIMNVSGIAEGRFARIKDRITV